MLVLNKITFQVLKCLIHEILLKIWKMFLLNIIELETYARRFCNIHST